MAKRIVRQVFHFHESVFDFRPGIVYRARLCGDDITIHDTNSGDRAAKVCA